MIRFVFSAFLVFCVVTAFSQDTAIPAAVQVSKSSKLILHTYALGVQVYVCQHDAKDTTHFVWVFKQPRATLYADSAYQKVVGKHYFNADNNPTWETSDGSKVSGTKLQQANGPDSNAIPWLLLKATAPDGTGVFKSTAFIQRLFTNRGKAPATADKSQLGKTLEVAYTAEYLFYIER